jgi:hypothetical protein
MQAALQGIDAKMRLFRREGKVKLRIIGVLLVFYLMARDKVTNQRHKYTKKNGSEYRTLRDTKLTVRDGRRLAAYANSLGAT